VNGRIDTHLDFDLVIYLFLLGGAPNRSELEGLWFGFASKEAAGATDQVGEDGSKTPRRLWNGISESLVERDGMEGRPTGGGIGVKMY
jgi:hypothetical protein